LMMALRYHQTHFSVEDCL